ncbi:MAG TPA: radical SAM/SPASM domain-containing protein [Candidatus Polarisedimenticolia bacterium]|nr:radical SAM/SPASM domain-containing protein [Candidatus Polarisedimenticolia bacterium]
MDRPGDGLWTRLANRTTRRPVPAFPRILQIQTFTGCNADCIFCPYGATYDSQPKGKMPLELFRRLIDEAAAHPVRRVSPYLMNEPLMDRDLFDKVRYINARLPRARVVLTTNGHFLTSQVTEELLDLGAGVHEIHVSLQGIDKEAYERTMRGTMRFERTMANVGHFIEAQRRRGGERPRLWVNMVDTALIDARAAVAYWRARGIASKYTTLENRGGNIHDADRLSRAGAMRPYTTCTRLFKQAYILFNGDMVLCCVDYARSQVLGNVARSSIREVWNGPVATEIRRRYLAREFNRLPLCGSCTIDEVREVCVEPGGVVTVREATS